MTIKLILFCLLTLAPYTQTTACNKTITEDSFTGCYEDWKFMIFDKPNFKGYYKCFDKGGYFAGRDCKSEYKGGFSFKVKKGYFVCFYDKRGRLIKKANRNDDYFNGRFYKFVVKKAGYDGSTPEEVACYKDWKFQIFDNPYFKGKYFCFRIGEFYAGKHCGNYWGKKISFKVRKGYTVNFYNKHGRLIKKVNSNEKYFVGNFYKFEVKRA